MRDRFALVRLLRACYFLSNSCQLTAEMQAPTRLHTRSPTLLHPPSIALVRDRL